MRKQWTIIILLVFASLVFSAPLKKDTAITISVGQFLDYADGKTILRSPNDLDVNDIQCTLSKNGAITDANLLGDNTLTLVGNGMATLELTATDTNTLGNLVVSFGNALSGGFSTETILPFAERYSVYPTENYDLFFGEEDAWLDTILDQIIADMKKSIFGF